MALAIEDDWMFDRIAESGNILTDVCHDQSKDMGWWDEVDEILALPGLSENHKARIEGWMKSTKLMLTVSELAEAMEGDRKNLMDNHLPKHLMMAVELADTVIRAFDLAGRYRFSLGDIIAQKLRYNAVRPDHKRENRALDGGKKY